MAKEKLIVGQYSDAQRAMLERKRASCAKKADTFSKIGITITVPSVTAAVIGLIINRGAPLTGLPADICGGGALAGLLGFGSVARMLGARRDYYKNKLGADADYKKEWLALEEGAEKSRHLLQKQFIKQNITVSKSARLAREEAQKRGHMSVRQAVKAIAVQRIG